MSRTARISLASTVALLGCVLMFSPAAIAMFAPMPEVPAKRLIQNIQKYIKAHPQDPNGYYQLGRTHYLAYVLRSDQVRVLSNGKSQLPSAQPFPYLAHRRPNAKPSDVKQAVILGHLRAAKTNLQKAIALDPGNALYHLTLASALDQGSADAWASEATTQPEDQKGDLEKIKRQATLRWQHEALDEYQKAFDLAIKKDRQHPMQPILGVTSLVSHEAAGGYVRLAEAMHAGKPYTKVIPKMKQAMAELESKPVGAVTPIIFSLKPGQQLSDLIARTATTHFDLDGTHRGWQWPWVKPETGILVWDPQHTGRVTSGRQLFGSVTWWIFWNNGYQAMAALDNNGDGQLTGQELAGIRVWFDRNGNGKADPGEVVSLQSLHITALATHPATHIGKSLANPRGITFADGRTLPTWDWVARPVTPEN